MSMSFGAKSTIRRYVKKLKAPIKIKFFRYKEGEFVDVAEELVKALDESTDLISVERYDIEKNEEIARKYQLNEKGVAFIITDKEEKTLLYYLGTPLQLELKPFLETLIYISSGEHHLKDEIILKLNEIKSETKVVVIVTPTCPYCAKVVTTVYRFAIANPKIRAIVVNAAEYPKIAKKYNVYAVPKVIINDRVSFEGALSDEQIVKYILRGAGIGAEIYYYLCEECGLLFTTPKPSEQCAIPFHCGHEKMKKIKASELPNYKDLVLKSECIVTPSKIVLDALIDMYPEIEDLAKHILSDVLKTS